MQQAIQQAVQSCLACISGKTRCDRKRPECSRCLKKGIICNYASDHPKGNGQARPRPTAELTLGASPETVSSLGKVSPPAVLAPQESDNSIINEDLFATLEALPGSFGEAAFEWDNPPAVDVLEPFTAPARGNEAAQTLAVKNNPFTISTTDFQTSHWFPLPRPPGFPDVLSIPRSPSNKSRSLIRRPKLKTGVQRVASLIWHTLKSYPLMMKQDHALPPFIHPQMAASESGARDIEPLHNCISLMQLLYSGLQGSRKLFWRNVRQECERLYKAPAELSAPGIIAALQALSIYIIVRLDDSETEGNDIEGLLIMTVIALSVELNRDGFGQDSALSTTSPESTWKHWLFVESGRRLCVLYQIVNMVVVFEPASMCDLQADGLILSPLPARKQLWEADTATNWMKEIERDLGAQTIYAMTVDGDLVKVSEGCPKDGIVQYGRAGARQKADWEEWFAGMDGFGGLVMLAASLVGQDWIGPAIGRGQQGISVYREGNE
ncbi:uncharacterized protein PG986_008798 [Apiospora aurea]|uniref:Zn(2)-C6 fungal-type domain-containing protein n=1 Tax=Apiospora aurea TaxID=335848 RepID=A0ABR1Q5S1_9PEZI